MAMEARAMIARLRSKSRTKAQLFLASRPTPAYHSILGTSEMLEFSFIVQRSLTCLDLSQCEFSNYKSQLKLRISRKKLLEYLGSKHDINRTSTEEGCKKRVVSDREILYRYHLDIPEGLEVSLRNSESRDIRNRYSHRVLLNKVGVSDNYYEKLLNRIITRSFEKVDEKVRLIHHALKLSRRIEFISENDYIRHQGLTMLCFHRANSAIVRDFLNVMDFKDNDYLTLYIDVFEFVLSHVGYDLWVDPSLEDPIHRTISKNKFLSAESLFQYRDSPKFSGESYGYMKKYPNRLPLTEDEVNMPIQNGLITKERHFLILEIVHVFNHGRSGGLKAMQMLWRSIPDPLITLDELALVCAKAPDSKIVQEICGFIGDITGEEVRDEGGLVPRKLKQYCRLKIRRILCNNKRLATDIGQLKLPPSLDSFIRLLEK